MIWYMFLHEHVQLHLYNVKIYVVNVIKCERTRHKTNRANIVLTRFQHLVSCYEHKGWCDFCDIL